MYLSKIRIWNFRKFGSESFDIEEPNLEVNFDKGLNVLIGENDSGKTAIIDAIKIVLKTHSYEWIRVSEEDFYNNTKRFRIELEFRDFQDEEAKFFTEWLSWEEKENKRKPYLRVVYDVKRTSERILPSDVRAGNDEEGYPLSAEAKYYLKTTYLKPLRNAERELIPKRYSRLSQILKGHEIFQDEKDNYLYKEFHEFNKKIAEYFMNGNEVSDNRNSDQNSEGFLIKKVIDDFITDFCSDETEAVFKTPDTNLREILENLELSIKGLENPGLGTLNRLFMAVELLHLSKDDWNGLKLGLIEELEAHLHPQVQLKVINSLQKQEDIQLILTTHSPNLASQIELSNLIICKNNNAFPMGDSYTELKEDNYKYLEKFLDVTKSNLFFANGVILVEGWSEQLLIPILANKLGKDLIKNEVSIINIGNLGFMHYYKIFLRRNNIDAMEIPVAVVKDLDIREYEVSDSSVKEKKDNQNNLEKVENYQQKCIDELDKKEAEIIEIESKDNVKKRQNIVKPFIAPTWTLEWCLFRSDYLGTLFKEALQEVHPRIFDEEDDIEMKLAERLIKSNLSINKTELIYKLNEKIRNIEKISIENISDEDTISYLIEAINYVCQN